MHFKKIGYMLVLVAVLLMAAACGNGTDTEKGTDTGQEGTAPGAITFKEVDRTNLGEDKVVAVYEGGEVKGSDFADYLAFQSLLSPGVDVNQAEIRQELVKYYIMERVVTAGLEPSEQEKERTKQFMEQLESVYTQETLDEGYATLGITAEKVEQFLTTYFLAETQFSKDITEEAVEEYYKQMQAELTTADVRHILVSTKEPQADGTLKDVRPEEEAQRIADDLYQQLQEGADFAELAKEHTEDPGSKESGGLYENYPAAAWTPEFKDAVLKQDVGEIGQPVKTMYGYHIIRVEKRETRQLDEVREALQRELAKDKLLAYFTEELPSAIKEINL